jgi:hypothetical protein
MPTSMPESVLNDAAHSEGRSVESAIDEMGMSRKKRRKLVTRRAAMSNA